MTSYLSPVLSTFASNVSQIRLTRGKMQYLWSDRTRYLDLLGQHLTVSVGHAHPRVNKAVMKQMNKLNHSSAIFSHEQSIKLSETLVKTLPQHPSGNPWVVHFVSSGSEANDLAIQLATNYTNSSDVFALTNSYHGLLGLPLHATDFNGTAQSHRNKLINNIIHITPTQDYSYPSRSTLLLESIQGYGGVMPLTKSFIENNTKNIQLSDGIVIMDEVQTGVWRTGTNFWGFQSHDIVPDIITCSKGIGNGFPLAATICHMDIANKFINKKFFSTHGGNPMMCAAGRATLRVIEEDNLHKNCYEMGILFKEGLKKLCQTYPDVYLDVRGSGLLLGLVVNKKLATSLRQLIIDHNIIIGMAGPDVFKIQPPMCINQNDVNYVLTTFKQIVSYL